MPHTQWQKHEKTKETPSYNSPETQWTIPPYAKTWWIEERKRPPLAELKLDLRNPEKQTLTPRQNPQPRIHQSPNRRRHPNDPRIRYETLKIGRRGFDWIYIEGHREIEEEPKGLQSRAGVWESVYWRWNGIIEGLNYYMASNIIFFSSCFYIYTMVFVFWVSKKSTNLFG